MKERNYGVDLLRIVAMGYVVVLHALSQGGLLQNPELTARSFYTVWFLEAWCFCSVNCFALISGYVGYRGQGSRLKLAVYMELWLQVVFYALAAAGIAYLIAPELVLREDIVRALTPLSHNMFWYFTAYTGLFFVIPLINACVAALEPRRLRRYTLAVLAVFSGWATLVGYRADLFVLHRGYSFVWLALMYFVGAAIKKTGLLQGGRTWRDLPLILATTLISVGWMAVSRRMNVPILSSVLKDNGLIAYISPMMVLSAILHLAVFSRLQPNRVLRWISRMGAPGALAVYLVNVQHFFWEYILKDLFAPLAGGSALVLAAAVLGFAVFFVVVILTADWLRRQLFRLLRVDKLTAALERVLRQLLSRAEARLGL